MAHTWLVPIPVRIQLTGVVEFYVKLPVETGNDHMGPTWKSWVKIIFPQKCRIASMGYVMLVPRRVVHVVP